MSNGEHHDDEHDGHGVVQMRCRGAERCRGTDVQRCRYGGAGVLRVQRCRGANMEVQRC